MNSKAGERGLKRQGRVPRIHPQRFKHHKLYYQYDPKKVAVFSALVAEYFLCEHSSGTSPHDNKTQEGFFADAWPIRTGQELVIAEDRKSDEIQKDEEKNECFH